MRPRLIIRLSADHASVLPWVALDVRGAPEDTGVIDATNGLPDRHRGRQVIALVDGREVLITSVSIPTQSRQRLLRAVPFALEDQLTEEVEDLHFAIGGRDATGRLWVAVVSRQRMDEWLDRLAEFGLNADQIYPDTLALPRHENAWTVLVKPTGFLVRTGPEAGFAGDPDNLATLLEAALEEAGDEPPASLAVYHAPRSEPDLTVTGPEVFQYPVENPLALMAEHLDIRHCIGLRVGRYARVDAARAHWRRWRVAAALLVVLIALETGRAWVENWRFGQEVENAESRLTDAFHRAFPGTSIPISQVRTVMHSRLERARAGDGSEQTGFLTLLSRIASTVDKTPNIELSAMSFRNNALEVELVADSLQTIDRLKQRLGETGGLSVEVRSAQSDGERIQGRLVIEDAS